ncbi:ketopantoate reductase family protein [Segnochrobactraceae bacterium EtOH-i3]
MRIGVIGAGAMGGLFGGSLALAGHDVFFIEVSPVTIQAVRTEGLRLTREGVRHVLKLPIGSAAEFSGVCDLLIVFTKGMHTRSAVEAAAHLVGPDTWALTVQNGLGNPQAIHAVIPPGRVAIGMTNWPADVPGPGEVDIHGDGVVRIWTDTGVADPRIETIAAALDEAGLGAAPDPQVEVVIWEKVAMNAAMNALCCLLRETVGGVAASADARAVADDVLREVVAVATAKGIAVSLERVRGMVAHGMAEHADHKPSMLQDRLAGRPTEIDFLNGAVVAEGKALGIPTPVTGTLARLVRFGEPKR